MSITNRTYLVKKRKAGKNAVPYLSETFSFVLSLTETVSDAECGFILSKSSAIGNINDDNNGSGAAFVEVAIQEDPPKRDCRFPSRSSLLNKESVERDPPLRDFLLR